jgi:hypothetical protein
MRLAWQTWLAIVLLACGCRRDLKLEPRFVPLEANPYKAFSRVPIIVVGKILSNVNTNMVRRSDNLCRLRVSVENSLKGDLQNGDQDFYYFNNLRKLHGSGQLGMWPIGTWRLGDRLMFFLVKEDGNFRFYCDVDLACAVPILTGQHPEFKYNPKLALGDNIAEVLLSRGVGCRDREMIEAMSSSGADLFSPNYFRFKLQMFAQTETSAVRKAASELLAKTTG